MGKSTRYKVGSVILTFDSEAESIILQNENSDTKVSLPAKQLINLLIANERVAHKAVSRRLISPGLIQFEKYEEKYLNLSNSDRLQLLMETFASKVDSSSASKFWIAFFNENAHRPDIVSRLIFEIKARNLSLEDFFLSYVYSNTDNIQANLHYSDYRISEREGATIAITNEFQQAASALIEDASWELDLQKGSLQEAAWWEVFTKGSYKWNQDDVLSFERLVRKLSSISELCRLAAIAQSIRPLSLFHCYGLISCTESKNWWNVVRTDAHFCSKELSSHLKLLSFLLSKIFSKSENLSSSFFCEITPGELSLAIQDLPIDFDAATIFQMLEYFSINFRDKKDREQFCSALRYRITDQQLLAYIANKQLKAA